MKTITIKGEEFEVRLNEKGMITGIWSYGGDGIYLWRGLYKPNKKYNHWENILPCNKNQFRYRILKDDYLIL